MGKNKYLTTYKKGYIHTDQSFEFIHDEHRICIDYEMTAKNANKVFDLSKSKNNYIQVIKDGTLYFRGEIYSYEIVGEEVHLYKGECVSRHNICGNVKKTNIDIYPLLKEIANYFFIRQVSYYSTGLWIELSSKNLNEENIKCIYKMMDYDILPIYNIRIRDLSSSFVFDLFNKFSVISKSYYCGNFESSETYIIEYNGSKFEFEQGDVDGDYYVHIQKTK